MYHHNHSTRAAQKVMVSMRDFFSKFDQIWRKFLIWLHLLKQSLMVKFIFVECFLTKERKRKKEILTFVRVPCRKLFLDQKLQQCQKSLYPKGTNINWTYITYSEDSPDVFWKSYVRSIYVMYSEGNMNIWTA